MRRLIVFLVALAFPVLAEANTCQNQGTCTVTNPCKWSAPATWSGCGGATPHSYVTTAAAASTITNNDFYAPTDAVVLVDATSYNCSAATAVTTLQTGNVCAAPIFVNPSTYDYHLLGTQGLFGAGATCSTDDIDQQVRAAVCTVGADEWTPSGVSVLFDPFIIPTR